MVASVQRFTKDHPSSGIPAEAQPWAWIAVAHLLRGEVGAPLRQLPDHQLRHMAASIGLYTILLLHYLAQWGLP